MRPDSRMAGMWAAPVCKSAASWSSKPSLKRGLCQQWGEGRWWAGQLQRRRSVVPEREPQHPPAPAPSSQLQGACSGSRGVGGSVASWPNALWVMDACQVFWRLVGRQGLSHLSDRSCFSVTRIPPGPAHHPSASREGGFFQSAVIVILTAAHKFSAALYAGSGAAC